MRIKRVISVVCALLAFEVSISCSNSDIDNCGTGNVTFNISADYYINESRATVELPVPDTLILGMLRDVNQVYKAIKVPLNNGVSSSFTQIVSSNTYTFIATNYVFRDSVYAQNKGRGAAWYLAGEERTVNTGDEFQINLTASVYNFKVTLEYSDGFNVLENCVATVYVNSYTDRKIEYPHSTDLGEAWFDSGSTMTIELAFTYNGEKKHKVYSNALSELAPEGVAQPATWYHITLTPTVASGDVSITVSSIIEKVNGGIDVNPKN